MRHGNVWGKVDSRLEYLVPQLKIFCYQLELEESPFMLSFIAKGIYILYMYGYSTFQTQVGDLML